MAQIVRASKFRHVFGHIAKKDQYYENFRASNCAFEGTFIAANGKWIAFCVEVGGGGAFVVVPHEKTGRLEPDHPKVSAHKEYIVDMQWNPYDDDMLATCSEDGSIKIWEIPDGGVVTNWDDKNVTVILEYHERRCVQIQWHPIANNVLLSVSQEPMLCVWNLDDGNVEVEIKSHPDIIWNASWSAKGDKIVTSCKDKKFRIFDARTGDMLVEGKGHEGSKAQRVIFTMHDKFLFSCGFSKMSERQVAVWDATDLTEQNLAELDTSNGCLIPFYDPDTELMYVAAKGDSAIRYYELDDESPFFHYISTYSSPTVQRNLAHIPKRNLTVNDCEVERFYKLVSLNNKNHIEPVSFTVPRKSEIFQEDLYPPAISDVSAQEAPEWFTGKNVEPNRIDMSTKFVGKVHKKKTAAGGGLKKGGGLKGLKAKKEEAAQTAAAEVTEKPTQDDHSQIASPSGSPSEPSARDVVGISEADTSTVQDMRKEIEALKEKDEERQKEMKMLKENDEKRDAELKNILDKLANDMADMKVLAEDVKKNAERISALEKLVEAESEEE